MNLKQALRDRRGTLYEVPILIAFVLLSLALMPTSRHWWYGPIKAAALLGAAFGGLMILVMISEKLEEFINLEPLRRLLASAPARVLVAALAYLAGAVGWGAAAAFASIFLAPRFSDNPAGQLQLMRALTALGAVGGLCMVVHIRRQGPRF